MDPTCVFNFFAFFERILYKSNCIIFIFSWSGTHTKNRSKLVVIVTAGSQKIALWGPQRTPLGILRVKHIRHSALTLQSEEATLGTAPSELYGITIQHSYPQPSNRDTELLPSLLSRFVLSIYGNSTSDLYRCTVHSVVYLINTPTNAHIFI